MEEGFTIRSRDIKFRRQWNINPAEKVESAKKNKREKNKLHRELNELELQEEFDNDY